MTRARQSTLSQYGTSIQLGLVLVILGSTATGVAVFSRSMSKVDATNVAVQSLSAGVAATNVVTAELNKNMVVLQGTMTNLSEKIGELQTDNKQGERDDQAKTAEIIRLQSDVQGLKDRATATESGVKTLESRILDIEIDVSRVTGSAPPARAGSE